MSDLTDSDATLGEIRRRYWTEVQAIADNIRAEAVADPDATSDDVDQIAHEACDAHSWVIYTGSAYLVPYLSDTDPWEEAAELGLNLDPSDPMIVSTLAYVSLLGDVRAELLGFDPEEAREELEEDAAAQAAEDAAEAREHREDD